MILEGRKFLKFLSEKEIDQIVSELAFQIDQAYQDQSFILIGVLNGSFMLVSDLAKKLNTNPQIQFMKYSSYKGTSSTGMVKKELGIVMELKDRHVLIVEDIVDTGNTLEQIVKEFEGRGLASLKIASLLLKPSVYKKSIPIDFVGREIPNDFVIGYGMDINGKGRGLADIYRLS